MLALLSDLHANLRALDACMAHARAQGAQRFAVLGDLVGYGAEPAAVLDRVMDLAAQGAVVLKGNHDELACAPPAPDQGPAQTQDALAAQWTRSQLRPAHTEFVAGLPLTVQVDDCLLVHASADAPAKWRYVDDARSAGASLEAALALPGVRHVMGGHVHHQTLYYRGTGQSLMAFKPTAGVPVPQPRHRQWIATVGSVGQPRDGDPRAMYALWDPLGPRITFHRVAYDHFAAAAAIRRSGQPEFFAQRLEAGR